jgi:VanZ family protein
MSCRFLPSLLWLSVITVLSLLPGNEIPHRGLFGIPNLDKAAHMGMYAILGFILVWSFKEKKWSKYILAVLFCLFYGGIMEILQANIAVNRSGNWDDWLADFIGAVAGLLVFRIFAKTHQ